jgi:xanthine/uracil permease
MKFRYEVDEKPPFVENVATGIMWAAVSLSFVLIIGMIISGMHTDNPGEANFYLQKLLFITGVALVIQVIAGHRLPVVFGPAAVLLVGTISSAGYSPDSVYTAIVISAVIGSLIAAAGLLQYIGRMFTTRVITVVLMLIAFTLIPTILDLIIGNCCDADNLCQPGA